jgi:hypothetical protein
VLILLNFRDVLDSPTEEGVKMESRISCDRVAERLKELNSVEGSLKIHCFDVSMQNCYGLKLLYSYLNVPFLLLKKKALMNSLKGVEEEALMADNDVHRLIGTSDYDEYLKSSKKISVSGVLEAKRPTLPKSLSVAPTPLPLVIVATLRVDESIPSTPAVGAAATEVPNDVESIDNPNPEEYNIPEAAKAALGSVDDEMDFLNERALQGNVLEDFFGDVGEGASDHEDDDEVAPQGSMLPKLPAPDESDDDEGYYAPAKFGLVGVQTADRSVDFVQTFRVLPFFFC